MSTRLYVRLHREANVPGARVPWILRDQRGAMLRRGEDTVGALPRADQIVGILAQDLVLIRPVGLPPGRRARTPIALANAMEPFLLSEPAANHVLVLGETNPSTTLLAAIARHWLDAMLNVLMQANRSPSRLIIESSLLVRAPERWIAVCRPDGGFLATGDGQSIALDATPDGGVPEGLRWQAQSAAGSASLVRVYHDATTRFDLEAWRSALGITVEDAGPWDWAQATGPDAGFKLEAVPDVLAAVGRERATAEPRLRAWRVPITLAAVTLVIHIGATAIHWIMRSTERAALRTEMNTVFRKSVSTSDPLVDAVLQTRRALVGAQRAAGQYAPDDFMLLLGRLSAETATAPPNALRSIQYGAGALSVEWRDLPAASVERVTEQLRARGLRVETGGTAREPRLTLRVEP